MGSIGPQNSGRVAPQPAYSPHGAGRAYARRRVTGDLQENVGFGPQAGEGLKTNCSDK